MQRARLTIPVLIAAIAIGTTSSAQRVGNAYVIDGDTLSIGGQRARVWGIDAPDEPAPMKAAARLYLARLIRDEGGVTCAFDPRANRAIRAQRAPSCPSSFRSYERIVTSCTFRRSGTDVAQRMTRAGYAVDWRGFSAGFYNGQQRAARAEGSGLWSSWPRQMAELAQYRGRQRRGCR